MIKDHKNTFFFLKQAPQDGGLKLFAIYSLWLYTAILIPCWTKIEFSVSIGTFGQERNFR